MRPTCMRRHGPPPSLQIWQARRAEIDFVARTTIDSVQMAMDILVRGFTDWNAWCPTVNMPSISTGDLLLTVSNVFQKVF